MNISIENEDQNILDVLELNLYIILSGGGTFKQKAERTGRCFLLCKVKMSYPTKIDSFKG
jgi:hypothetical protein